MLPEPCQNQKDRHGLPHERFDPSYYPLDTWHHLGFSHFAWVILILLKIISFYEILYKNKVHIKNMQALIKSTTL